MTCHARHKWQGKMAWRGFKQKKEKEKECKRIVNKSYRNVTRKVAKSTKRLDKRQFTHCSIAEHSIIYIYYIFIIYYYRVTNSRNLFAVFCSR